MRQFLTTGHSRKASVVCALLLLAGLLALLTGCGSSGNSSSGAAEAEHATASTSGAGSSLKGKPIKVGTMAPVDAPLASFPEIFAGVRAAARNINQSGGINGRPVVVLTCNTKQDPNLEAACARKLVNDGAIALVGSQWILSDAAINQTLASAHVVDLAGSAPQPVDFQGTAAYPIDFLPGAYIQCATVVPHVVKTPSLVTAALTLPPVLKFASDVVAPAAAQAHLKVLPTVKFPPTTTNFAPVVQQLTNSGSKYVVAVMSSPFFSGLLASAAQSGTNLTYCIAEGLETAASLAQVGQAASSVYVAAPLPVLTAAKEYPIVQEFQRQMKDAAAGGDSAADLTSKSVPAYALRAWLGMQVFKHVATSMKGEITPATFQKAISTAKVKLGNLLDLDFAKPRAIGPFKRVFNANMYVSKFDPAKKDFYEVQAAHTNLLQP